MEMQGVYGTGNVTQDIHTFSLDSEDICFFSCNELKAGMPFRPEIGT